MMWWIVVLTSAGLIVLGIGLLVRDVIKSRADKSPRRQKSMKTSKTGAAGTVNLPTTVATAAQAQVGTDGGGDIDAAPTPTVPVAPRLPALEKLWPRLRPEIEAAVASINQQMAPLSLSIGQPGETTWSLHNQGFGDYRRILIDRNSIAWLRLEIAADRSITVRLRAHDAENTAFNRNCAAPSQRTPGQLVQTLTECLAGAFDYAVWRHSNNVKNDAIATPAAQVTTAPMQRAAPPPPPPPQRATSLTTVPATMPSPAAALVETAVALVNRAFAEAGAQLLPSDARHGTVTTHADRAFSITAHGTPVALMLIEPRADRIDISVGVPDPANVQAARRQSQPMAGLTVHALAEAIATNAWPAIAAASTQAAVA